MEYNYSAGQNEINFKIIVNKKADETFAAAYDRVRNKLAETDGYCPCKIDHNPDTKCMCREFRDCDEEGDCQCGFYTKILRTDKEKESYLTETKFKTGRVGRKSNKEKEEDRKRAQEEKYLIENDEEY